MAVNKRIKRRIILLATLCLVLGTALAGVYFYSKWNKQKQIDYAYEQGMAAYESGDFVKALPLLSKAAAGIKDDADLIFALDARLKNVDPAVVTSPPPRSTSCSCSVSIRPIRRRWRSWSGLL